MKWCNYPCLGWQCIVVKVKSSIHLNLYIKDTLGPAIFVLNREVSSSRRLSIESIYTESIGNSSFGANKIMLSFIRCFTVENK